MPLDNELNCVSLQHFSVHTVISGSVRVTIYKETGDEKTFLMSLQPKDIAEIVKYLKKSKKLLIPKFVKIERGSVRVKTKGQCEFTYAVEQNVVTYNT